MICIDLYGGKLQRVTRKENIYEFAGAVPEME